MIGNEKTRFYTDQEI